MHENDLVRTDERLTVEQQQAVLILAARLQQDIDEGATLDDLIQTGQEAGISREAVEEAYRIVVSQTNESSLRRQLSRSLGNELAAVHLTIVWVVATWLGVTFLPMVEIFGQIGVGSTFLVYPFIVGLLVRRSWVAAALALATVMNLMIAFSIRFGMPTQAGARADMIIFALPVVLAFGTSWLARGLGPMLNRGRARP